MSGHFNGGPAGSATPSDDEESFVYTSIRYDTRLLKSDKNTAASCGMPCPFYMLEHHWTRLQIAKWSTFCFADDRPRSNSRGPSVLYSTLLKAVKQWHEKHPGETPESLRIKVRAYVGGRVRTEIYFPLRSIPMEQLFPSTLGSPTQPWVALEWTIVLDSQATEPSEGTMFKTNDRSAYGRARAAAEILTYQIPKEVLLFSSDGNILDGSICTPYCYRNGAWVTPDASAGGLQGTTRRWALEQGLAVEGKIAVDSFRDGEIVWLSNAVRGYFPARFEHRASAAKVSGDVQQQPAS
ncbi:uncharacterized protein MYCFIDRAFT_136127 [Pseudocercospora fijiensis CIRAD86]|uniref:Aminodeoxychorismate lyase n=1 Tax=Pseudocercospora fijiensis (strain CIRAD86) TaxID=383855 RepID=M2YZF5_PSEFD|nr:uncharacterized protein MYCFIDRAFT_136127 [Pseudocercospora fijiensis CIRAD86]EME83010.1 hypothetical protein MYCFIDRAFT_136127 [Pseudocercospora fijiensis CIRAD86]